jgi:hypothetical protein
MNDTLISPNAQAARELVFTDLQTELESRMCHWGDERHKGWKAWALFLMGDVGDVAREVSRAGSDREDGPALYRALIAIAGLAIAWLSALRWSGVSAAGIDVAAHARARSDRRKL